MMRALKIRLELGLGTVTERNRLGKSSLLKRMERMKTTKAVT